MTATDLTVRAHNLCDIGDGMKVQDISEELVQGGQKTIYKLLSVSVICISACTILTLPTKSAIDKMKTSPEDIDVLLVGGGSIICPSSLRGVNQIMYAFSTPHLAPSPFAQPPIFNHVESHPIMM